MNSPIEAPMNAKRENKMEPKRGDYVKLKKGVAGNVGVVWQIHPEKIASIEVYWLDGKKRLSTDHEAADLTVLAPSDAPDYAIELRSSLGF